MKYPYAQPELDEADRQAVLKVLHTTQITRGPTVEAFEQAVATYCGARFAVAFSSGTSAMNAAYLAIGSNPCDSVVTSPNTFVGTVTGALRAKARLHLVDIDPVTGNLDIDQMQSVIPSAQSRGQLVVVPVHYRGAPVNMRALNQAITLPNTMIIEDAAHAFGGNYLDGKKIGCCSDSAMTMFSFHAVKTITTGEGGLITTNDPLLERRLRTIRNNGIVRPDNPPGPWYYEVRELSGNFHMTELAAALGCSQLTKVDQFVQKRRALVAGYRQRLTDTPFLSCLDEQTDTYSSHHLFVVRIDFASWGRTRQELMARLADQGIGTQVHYIPLYRHPAVGGNPESYPQSESFYEEALSLPLYTALTEGDLDVICERLTTSLHKTS